MSNYRAKVWSRDPGVPALSSRCEILELAPKKNLDLTDRITEGGEAMTSTFEKP
jgi:hypothetical protein